MAVLPLMGCQETDAPEQGVDTTILEDGSKPELVSSETSLLAEAGLDLSNSLKMTDPSYCRYDGETETAFNRMLAYNWQTNTETVAPSVSIANRTLKTDKSESSDPEYPGSRFITVSARFPEGTKWNGLSLSRLIREQWIYPESDGGDSRTVSFLNTPNEVKTAFQRVGVDVPLAPEYRELPDDGCGGSMQIVSMSGGAALSCGFGC